MIHGNGERHNYGSKNIISHRDLYFTTDTEAHVTIGKRNYGSRNTISDRDLYLTQDDTSKHKHTGRQEQRSARYKQMQEHNETSGTRSRAVVVLHYITRCTNVLVKNGIRG